MNLQEAEIQRLDTAKNSGEWNAACDDIKRIRSGSYPPDWWDVVMLGGIAARFEARTKTDMSIRIHTY